MAEGEEEASIQLVTYDERWPASFEAERRLLEEALAPWLAATIEHVGSTALPGLLAKPIVDIMAGVRDLEHSRPAIAALEPLDYCYSPYKPTLMHWFCKPRYSHRTHHLHLVPFGNPLWRERLAFRDYLRAHPDAAADYAAFKRQLAKRHPNDREAYTDAKGPFVARIAVAALASSLR